VSAGAAVAARARAAVGARFRLHGREAATGLDCLGLAALAYGVGAVPSGYSLRGGDAGAVAVLLDRELARGDGRRTGDLLLFASGPGQLHFGIGTDAGVVHADAGLRRVVERPGVAPWVLLGCWRREG
jgi:cell wall-associated NlpC family hydrolase